MSATMVNSENVWQDASPKWFPTGSINPGGGCSGITATNQGMLLSTDWTTNTTKTITTTITFSSPVQGPVNFKLYDINDDGFGSWEDRMIITGTNSVAAPVNIFKVGTACVQTGGTVTGSGTPTLTFNSGQSTSCTCWGNNEINVGTATDCISTITIQYKSNVSPTNYNNPKQYVVISNLTAIIPIATAPTSITGTQSICAGQSTTLTAVGGNASTQWYTGSCGGTLVGTGTSITVTPGSTTTYYVRNAASACVPASACIPVTVTVNPSPTMTSINSTSICSGTTLNLPLTSDFGTSYSWVAANNPNTSGESTSAQSSSTINNTIINNTAIAQTVVYTVTPSASGCAGPPQTVNVTVNPGTPPTFNAVAPICNGAPLAALPTTSNNGFNGSWSPAINNTATTLYTFTPTAGQCATTTTMTITVNSGVTPTFTAVAPICTGDPLAALPTTSNNGINGTWSPAINNTTTTTYTFTPAAGQCATSTTITISVGPPATPTFTAVTPICTGNPLAALPTTSNNGFTGTWSPAINNTATTLYTFVPIAGQCATSTTMTITVNSNVTPTFTAVAPICTGEPLAALPTISNNGINGTWSPAINNTATTLYTFTPASGQCATSTTMTITVNSGVTPTFTAVAPICNGDPLVALPTTSNNGITGAWSPAINNTATTLYTFTPASGQCATSTTMTISVGPPATPTFTAVTPICLGDPLAALPTTSINGFTGTWSPAINNTATTLYTFAPTAGQCATTTTMTISVNSSVTPTFTAVTPICNGDALAALPTTSNNAITGTWSPAINNTATTLYTFSPSAGQCATSTALTITVNSSVTPTFTAVAPICNGDPLAALPTTSNNGINGTWSPAINNTTTTLYTFTPTAGQCATTTTMTISVGPPATPTFTAVTPICLGDPLAALPTTSINGFTGTWSPAINNSATTLYTYTPTAGQCATSTTLTISVNPIPIIDAGLDQTICAGATVSLNGSGASTYFWNNGITNGTAFNPIATTTYTVSGTDANGCINTDQVDVIVNTAPIVNAGPDATVCIGASTTLTASGAATYSWSPSGQTTTSINVSPLSATTYTVTGTDANGCSSTDQVDVFIIPLPNVIAGLDQTICVGSSINLSGSGALTYSWNYGVTNGVAFQPSSTTTYTVTGTTIEGCENSDDVTIIVNQTLPVTFTADVTNGCAPLTVTLINTTANTSDCNWVFSNGTTLNGCGTVTTTFTQAGCYDVTLNTSFLNGCNGSQTATDLICVENAPDASFNQSANSISEFDPFIDFTNTSIGANSYSWDFGDNSSLSSEVNPSHDYSDSPEGLFQVMLIAYSTNGCADTAYSNFQFNEELIFYVPNTFTPDGDIFNQEFLPIFSSGYDPYDYNLAIYNRWGEIIFESNNSEIGWDGSYGTNGEIVMSQDGTYTWKITFKTIRNDERKFVVGHVNLVR